MTTKYKPTIWARRYRTMAPSQRELINKKTNEIFRVRTGVTRKLDPKHDGHLCKVWLELRDQMMMSNATLREAANHRPSQSRRHGIVDQLGDVPFYGPALQAGVEVASEVGKNMLDLAQAPWLAVARAEHAKGVVEYTDKKVHNPEIMKYLKACDNLYDSDNATRYTERVGPKEVAWCAAFVNWCLGEVGIRGTRHAWALHFAKWGKRIEEPEVGALVVQQTSSWRHVAFIDEVNGELKVLGGNQKHANGKGSSNQVSYRPLNRKITVAYVWPD